MARINKIKQVFIENELEKDFKSKANTEILEDSFPRCTTHGCKGCPIITDNASGEVLCGACGFVMSEKSIDPNSDLVSDALEYRTKTRTGPEQSLTMYDRGMTTVMSDKDAMGLYLSGSMKAAFERLKILDNRSRSSTSSRTLKNVLLLLSSLKTKLGLPDSVAENAAYIYRKAMLKRITVGRSANSLMCASVYVACRQTEIPRSLLDISLAANVRKKEVGHACRDLIERLEISLNPCNASEFVTKIANDA
ncbi:MAG: hypothetical protein ACREAN_00665, partial [Nitrosopumilaceae archaeon]